MALAHGRLGLQRRPPSADRREWLNKALPPTSHKNIFTPLEVWRCLSSGAPMSPALVCRRIKAMVRSCQCSANVAISASKSGHRVDAGLTREVENGKGRLDTHRRHCSVYRRAFRNGDDRATNEVRHGGIGVPTHHKRAVTLCPPHEHRGGRALARAGF